MVNFKEQYTGKLYASLAEALKEVYVRASIKLAKDKITALVEDSGEENVTVVFNINDNGIEILPDNCSQDLINNIAEKVNY